MDELGVDSRLLADGGVIVLPDRHGILRLEEFRCLQSAIDHHARYMPDSLK